MTRRSEAEEGLKVSHHGNTRSKGPETGTRRLTKSSERAAVEGTRERQGWGRGQVLRGSWTLP